MEQSLAGLFSEETIMDNSSIWRSILVFILIVAVIGALGVLFFAGH